MKILKLTLIAVLLHLSVVAQDCSTFYPFTEGTVSTVTSYDKRGNVSASQEVTIMGVSTVNGLTTANVKARLKDKNGDLITESTFDVFCNGSELEIDFKSMMSPDLFDQFRGMETEISGTNIIMPNNLTVGDELPDAEMNMKVNMGGINMNMEVTVTNRKVIAQENLTTPAGTFDCYVIEYTTMTKMGMARTGQAKQWVAKGVGMVKQEDYNNRGRILGRNLLTSFSE